MQTSLIDLQIDGLTQKIHSHATAAAQHANTLAKLLLSMSDDELTAWLRANAEKLEVMFARHETVGLSANTLLETTAAQLEIPTPELVNVLSVADKLAAQRRVIDWQTLTVSTLPPEPQPEPPAE